LSEAEYLRSCYCFTVTYVRPGVKNKTTGETDGESGVNRKTP